MKYFRERPQDLLVLDFAKGDGWEKLCRFLGADIPESEFPHANKAIDREIKSIKIRDHCLEGCALCCPEQLETRSTGIINLIVQS